VLRGVAQPGSALAWGARGREFESRRPDQLSMSKNDLEVQASRSFLFLEGALRLAVRSMQGRRLVSLNISQQLIKNMHAILPLLKKSTFPQLRRRAVSTLQVNLGYLCNQSCVHCHVNAGPNRTELMDLATVNTVLEFARVHSVKTIDLTGGAPELNPHFLYLVTQARKLDIQVIDRCNLTILYEPGQHNLAQFLADKKVAITASLPCYLEDNVDAQRGKGVFQTSIKALQALNALGYAQAGTGLELNLVYNPQGPVLPPDQVSLQADYKRLLQEQFGIQFNQLYAIANMPIQRFGSTLVSKKQFDPYMDLLRSAHRPENLGQVMCLDMLSIDWQGYVYDCDFNQMLGLGAHCAVPSDVPVSSKPRVHLTELVAAAPSAFLNQPIVVRDHCYACTAGQGSSCGGSLAA
jgi:radical SAM/Cys-rich protein